MTPERVAVLISGRGSNLMSLVAHTAGYTVVLVASDNPAAPGLVWAREQGIDTFTLDVRSVGRSAWELQLLDRLAAAQVRVVALAGYMRILTAGFIDRFGGAILNIHPSLLPAYKGLDTHQRALDAGDAEAGCSVHLVTEDLDAGTVLGQARVPIRPEDTAATLAARVLAAEHRLYPQILAEYCAR